MESPKHGGALTLLDLPDSILHAICSFLNPKPDLLYGLAQTCQRFRQLVNDPGASHHLVVHPSHVSHPHANHLGQSKHFSLEAALNACRPGSTIRIQPGLHIIRPKNGLIIKTSVNIIGDSTEETVLRSPEGCDAALDIRATCKIMGLAVEAVRGSCVLHRAGHLSMEGCRLSCDAKGLDHLCSPLVTTATTRVGRPLEGPGKLTIAECSLEGGSVAIQCLGTGSLASVRVIYRARHKSYFLGVDCQVPGIQQPRPPHMQQAASIKDRGAEGIDPSHQSNQLLTAVQGTAAGIAALARLLQSGSTTTMAEPPSLVSPDSSQADDLPDPSESVQVLESVRLGLHEVPHRHKERYKF